MKYGSEEGEAKYTKFSQFFAEIPIHNSLFRLNSESKSTENCVKNENKSRLNRPPSFQIQLTRREETK